MQSVLGSPETAFNKLLTCVLRAVSTPRDHRKRAIQFSLKLTCVFLHWKDFGQGGMGEGRKASI